VKSDLLSSKIMTNVYGF